MREGIEILYQKKIKKLIISGVYQDANYYEIFPYWLYYPELKSQDIILEKRSMTTLGNAYQSIVFVEANQCKDIYLMTSQLHMYRAHKIFRDVFPDSIEIKKITFPNSKAENSILGLATEVVKTLFYNIYRLVR